MGALYRLTFPNGKAYIGITGTTAVERFAQHRQAARRKRQLVHKAISKYGADSVVCETLAIANDWSYLCELERRAIAVFGSNVRGNGYNATAGGDGFRGRHTPEAIAKIRDHSRRQSAETRRKIGDAFRGRRGSNAGCKHSADSNRAKAVRQISRPSPIARNTSGHTGVYWNKAAGKWQAYCKVNGKARYLGIFSDMRTAVLARQQGVDACLRELGA